MKKILLVLLTLAGTISVSSIFGPHYEYDQKGNRYKRQGLVSTVAHGIVNTGEDVVDIATSPARGGYREVRLNTLKNRVEDAEQALKKDPRNRNLKAKLRNLQRQQKNLKRQMSNN